MAPPVVHLFHVHGANQADVVDDRRDVRKQLAHRQTALAVLSKLPRRFEQCSDLVELPWRVKRQWFAVHLCQLRFGVKRVDVRHAAVHE